MDCEVSILIPTFNRGHLIERAIRTSLEQSYKCKVIVCDHGSTDNTKEICSKYLNKITYVRRETDYGIHFCELEAILTSKTKFIHFCFDDDWMHYKYIEECMKLMDKNTGIVFTNNIVVDTNAENKIKDDWSHVNKINSKKLISISKIPHVIKGLISPSCALIRKKDAIKCLYNSTNLVSDKFYNGVGPDWLMTAMPLFRYQYCGYIKTPLVKFGSHDQSITIDVLSKNDENKKIAFRQAYNGAKIYLIISTIIRIIKFEKIYNFISDQFVLVNKVLKLLLGKKTLGISLAGIKLSSNTIPNNHLDDLAEWISSYPRLTKDKLTTKFENQFSNFINTSSSIFVNSGSSANLLLATANLHYKDLRNKKVGIPAVSWSTTLSPFIQLGYEPFLLDCDRNNLGIDIDELYNLAKKEDISTLILVHVLGHESSIIKVKDICDEFNIRLFEDSCEALGSKIKDKKLGSFGLASSFSFYYGHHISTIEGGMVCTDNFEFSQILKSLRSHGWSRDLEKNFAEDLQKDMR